MTRQEALLQNLLASEQWSLAKRGLQARRSELTERLTSMPPDPYLLGKTQGEIALLSCLLDDARVLTLFAKS